MAFLNGKYTSFDPQINITAGTEVYYSTEGWLYTPVFRVKANYGTNYAHSAELTKIIYDGSGSRLIYFDVDTCANLEEIAWENESAADWDTPMFSMDENSSVKKFRFESVSEEWTFDTYAELAYYFVGLEEIEVFEGWDYDIVCYSENLTVESIIGIIENLADISEGESHTIDFATISDVPEEYIEMAVNKGWSVG